MSDWLLYWKDHKVEDDYEPFIARWHTKQERFFRQLRRRDCLWVVVNGGTKRPDAWLLCERISVMRKKRVSNPGLYQVLGDSKKSERYQLVGQADLSPLLHRLQIKSGKRIKAQGRSIGLSIQTNRPLADSDELLLEKYSRTKILIEPR